MFLGKLNAVDNDYFVSSSVQVVKCVVALTFRRQLDLFAYMSQYHYFSHICNGTNMCKYDSGDVRHH